MKRLLHWLFALLVLCSSCQTEIGREVIRFQKLEPRRGNLVTIPYDLEHIDGIITPKVIVCYDNRIDISRIPLYIRLLRGERSLYEAEISIPLSVAHNTSSIGATLIEHEAIAELPTLKLSFLGVYQIEIKALQDEFPEGVVALGVQIK